MSIKITKSKYPLAKIKSYIQGILPMKFVTNMEQNFERISDLQELETTLQYKLSY